MKLGGAYAVIGLQFGDEGKGLVTDFICSKADKPLVVRFSGGQLSDDDVEVAEVAWVPVHELPSRLAYADERRLAEVAGELIHKLQTDGPAALPPLPPSAPRRRPQTHSRTRNRRPDESAPGRTNGCGPSP